MRKSKTYLCPPKKEGRSVFDLELSTWVAGAVVQLFRMLPCHLAQGETGSRKFFMYYVYMLESLVDGDFYKGATKDYAKRLSEHNNGESQFTRSKMPWKLVFLKVFETKQAALTEEKRLKKCNKEYLRWLITQPQNILNNNGL